MTNEPRDESFAECIMKAFDKRNAINFLKRLFSFSILINIHAYGLLSNDDIITS